MSVMQKMTMSTFLICLLFLQGCVTERFSWNQDGTRLAIIDPENQNLWVWDVERREPCFYIDQDVVAVRFVDANRLLYGVQTGGRDEWMDLKIVDLQTGAHSDIHNQVLMHIDIDTDGALYYVRKSGDESLVLCRYPFDTKDETVLFQHQDLVFFDLSPTRSRLLICHDDNQLVLYEKTGDAYQPVTTFPGEVIWPQWIDDERFLGFRKGPSDDEGVLFTYSLPDHKNNDLFHHVFLMDLPSVQKIENRVLVTEQRKTQYQVVSIDLNTGKQAFLTEEPLGAGYAVPSPDGKKLAYITPADSESPDNRLKIKNLQNDKKQVLWRNEEMRWLSAAKILHDEGHANLAISLYEDFRKNYPDSELTQTTWFDTMMARHSLPSTKFDQVYEAFQRSGWYQRWGLSHIWSQAVGTVDDSQDWITRFGTSKSKQKYGFDTDLPRDLLGLSAKWTEEYLYLKIDYNSPRDISGLVFQDTYILFDYNDDQTANTPITPRTVWDRGAERVIALRHWFPGNRESQYNADIVDEKGNAILSFRNSGYPVTDSSAFHVVQVENPVPVRPFSAQSNRLGKQTQTEPDSLSGNGESETGAIVLSISWDLLPVKPGQAIYIQVCTTKGGIESFDHVEKQVSELTDDECDLADVVGTYQLQSTGNKNDNPTTFILRGYALQIVPSKQELHP